MVINWKNNLTITIPIYNTVPIYNISERLQKEDYRLQLSKMLTSFKQLSGNAIYKIKNDTRYEFVYKLINNDKCSDAFSSLMRNGFYKEFKLDHYYEPKLRELMVIFKDNRLFEHWIKTIT